MRRHALGILAALLLASGLTGLAVYGVGDDRTSMLLSMCLRIGIVLGAVWLAFPQLIQMASHSPPWLWILLAVCGVIVIVRPRSIVVIGPLAAVLMVLYFVGWLLRPPAR